MKLISILKYQHIEKEQLVTCSQPVVLKLNMNSNTFSICTLDLLRTMECVHLDQAPTFVSRLGVLACKYQECGKTNKFQIHIHKKDMELLGPQLKNIFGVNWKSKDNSNGNTQVNTQQCLDYTQPNNSMTDYTQRLSLSNSNKQLTIDSNDKVEYHMVVKADLKDCAMQTVGVPDEEFNESDLQELLKNPAFIKMVIEAGNSFTTQFYACQ